MDQDLSREQKDGMMADCLFIIRVALSLRNLDLSDHGMNLTQKDDLAPVDFKPETSDRGEEVKQITGYSQVQRM